jgi:hypothetical protein
MGDQVLSHLMEQVQDRANWWRQRRAKYNIGLALSGVLAFICYLVALELSPNPQPGMGTDVTFFTIAFQGVGYLLMMGIANFCYGLGPLVEKRLSPSDPERFRRITYRLGCIFSFALPFTVPLLVLLRPY